jgi:hypothetical protein
MVVQGRIDRGCLLMQARIFVPDWLIGAVLEGGVGMRMVERALLVSVRGQAHEVERLGMRCDRREIPYPLDAAEKPVGTWTAVAEVSGRDLEAEVGAVRHERVFTGGCALAITADRVIGIIAPLTRRGGPSVWFALPLDGINAIAGGHQGRRGEHRPEKITLGGSRWMAVLTNVSCLRSATGKAGKKREQELIDALHRRGPDAHRPAEAEHHDRASRGRESRELKKARRLLSDASRLHRGLSKMPAGQQAEAVRRVGLLAEQARALAGKAPDPWSGETEAMALGLMSFALVDGGEVDEALACVGIAALRRRHLVRQRHDVIAAHLCHEAARIYTWCGDLHRAAAFAVEAELRQPPQAGTYRVFLLGTLLEARDRKVDARNVFRSMSFPSEGHMAGIERICQDYFGIRGHDLETLTTAARDALAGLDSDESVAFVLYVARRLRDEGHTVLAAGLLEETLQDLRDRRVPLWELARVHQLLAVVHARQKRWHDVREHALAAWVIYDELRYRIASPRLRNVLSSSCRMAFRDAMRAASALGDGRLMAELVESSRMQAAPAPSGQSRPATRVFTFNGTSSETQGGQADDEPSVTVHEPYSYAVADGLAQPSALSVPADIYVAGRSALAEARQAVIGQASYDPLGRVKIDLEDTLAQVGGDGFSWIASAVADRRIFLAWRAASETGFTGTAVDVFPGSELERSLSSLSAIYNEPGWLGADPDAAGVNAAFGQPGSWEESRLTEPLRELIPASVLAACLNDVTASHVLVLSVAPELSILPWPLIPLEARETDRRLIEACELRFCAASLPLIQVAATTPAARPSVPLPFLLSCEYFDTPGPDTTDSRPRDARRRYGPPDPATQVPGVSEATLDNVLSGLRSLSPGQPGLAYFVGHCATKTDEDMQGQVRKIREGMIWPNHGESQITEEENLLKETALRDPRRSGLALCDHRLLTAEALLSGSGGTALALPSHLVLSACATAMTASPGGEALGLAAAALHCGARHIVATAVSVPRSQFARAWDDQLIAALAANPDHFAALRGLQIEALQQWKTQTSPGQHADPDHCFFPDPYTWAYYQALGIPVRNMND